MKITEHVYFYLNKAEELVRSSNNTVIVSDNKQIIIDPGSDIKKGFFEELVDEMEKDGLDINKTNEIWLTHAHPDHYQAIHGLFKKFKEQRLVRCHPFGEPIIRNPRLKDNFFFREKRKAGPYWKLVLSYEDIKAVKGSLGRMTQKGISILGQKVETVKPFCDGETIDISSIKVQIVFLPGHAPDEVGFWMPKEKVLILGDLVCVYHYQDNRMIPKVVFNNFYADLDAAVASLKRMKEIKNKIKFFGIFNKKAMPEILLTAHSDPVRGKDNIQKIFTQLMSKIEDYKTLANTFIEKHADLSSIQLIKALAQELPDRDLYAKRTERRFVAFAILKSSGAIE